MAKKTITSEPFTLNLPGATRPLNFKTETTFEADVNGNPINETQKTELKYQVTPGGIFQTAATSTDGGKAGGWTVLNKPNSNDSILGAQAILSLQTPNGVLNQLSQNSVIAAATKDGIPAAYQKPLAARLQNTAPPPDGGDPTGGSPTDGSAPKFDLDQQKDTEKAFAKGVGRPSSSYESVRYPEYLQLDHQDCIQFSILEYNPRGLSLEKSPERRRLDGKSPIATITLPIPSGISDSNQVDWQKDDLDLATQGIADVVINAVAEGSAAAGDAASKNLNTLLNAEGKKTLEAIVAVKSAQALLGTNVLSRKYGGVLNPNSELLFSGPQLRTFSFTFRMYPRSSDEAILVRKIIRYFKQAMSVQRGESILVLKAPHTFGIKYLTSSKNEHPYLNKFKECALTQCNVNYTPDGTYMTYAGDEPSMTAYELQLQFQELEPIFNDDYGNEDTQIGY